MSEDLFQDQFGSTPQATVFVPGRVNLIGEHIDYNGGCVLPFPLAIGVTVALKLRDDGIIRIYSDRFDQPVEVSSCQKEVKGWANYAVQTVRLTEDLDWFAAGADIAISSTLPDGAGLSSSAALIVAILKAMRQATNQDVSDTDIAVLARRVENDYIGVPCGIMDQMAVAIATPGTALFLDTQALTYEPLELPQGYQFLAIHSGIQRELSDGRYHQRAEECAALKATLGRQDLCKLTDQELLSAERHLPPTAFRRLRHCVTEHRRTLDAADALRREDVTTLGRLLQESHLSMRDDFEMSVQGIDTLVQSVEEAGATAARLTGGGFGGCIVACVADDVVPSVQECVRERHAEAWIVNG